MLDQIHIIAPFTLGNGGDWQAIDLYLEYKKRNPAVTLWTQHNNINLQLRKNYPIQEVRPYKGIMPYKGTLIISGADTEIGQWFENAHFHKIIIIHNLVSPAILYKALHRLNPNGKIKIEIQYVSELVKRLTGLEGKVLHHIPSPLRFRPSSKKIDTPFTVGRASMDYLNKHYYNDIKFYQLLANEEIQIRILGGRCLMPWLANKKNITLLPTVDQSEMKEFYNSVDCFYYRIPSVVKEAYGLVVIEAMLSGLPVICHKDVGASELINHGVNGFVFSQTHEAYQIINELKKNANLALEIGMQARTLTLN